MAWVVVVPLTADDEDPPLGRVPSIAGSDSLLGVQGRDMMVGSKKKEAEGKARVEAECTAEEQAKQDEHNFERSQNYSSPPMEEEE